MLWRGNLASDGEVGDVMRHRGCITLYLQPMIIRINMEHAKAARLNVHESAMDLLVVQCIQAQTSVSVQKSVLYLSLR